MVILKKICLFFCLFFFSIIAFAHAETSSENNTITFFNWSEYIDPELILSFEKKYHAKVKQLFFTTDETKEEILLETKGEGFDVVLSSDIPISQYIKQGWLSRISETDIPNVKHIDDHWRNARPEISAYAIPYVWGTIGIVYRKDFVKKEVNSWLDLYLPQENLRGKIVMIEDSKETIGMALKALGYSINSEDKAHYDEVRELLYNQKPYVFDYSYVALNEESSLVTGKIGMAMVYNGDGLMLEQMHPKIAFSVPKEGTSLWIDYLVIMKNSKNKKLACQFINFLNEPKNAAQLAEYLMFATPNKAAKEFLSLEHLNNKRIYPDRETMKNSEVRKKLSPRIEKKIITMFTEIKQ